MKEFIFCSKLEKALPKARDHYLTIPVFLACERPELEEHIIAAGDAIVEIVHSNIANLTSEIAEQVKNLLTWLAEVSLCIVPIEKLQKMLHAAEEKMSPEHFTSFQSVIADCRAHIGNLLAEKAMQEAHKQNTEMKKRPARIMVPPKNHS